MRYLGSEYAQCQYKITAAEWEPRSDSEPPTRRSRVCGRRPSLWWTRSSGPALVLLYAALEGLFVGAFGRKHPL